MDSSDSPFMEGETTLIPPLKSGRLSNLRFAVKELYDVKGFITGCGNARWKSSHTEALDTAPSVKALLTEGATLIGKTISDEMAFSLDGENIHYGTPLNPWDSSRTPGGSSSGSASAVAQGLVDFSLGTDTAGSIRVPASYCGIFGFRPTHGRISTAGIHPMAPSFDTVGWFAATANILKIVGEAFLQDTVQPRMPSRLTIPTTLIEHLNPEIHSLFFEYLASLKVDFEKVVLPGGDINEWIQVLQTIQWWELNKMHGDWIRDNIDSFGEEIRGRLEKISTVSEEDVRLCRIKRQCLMEELRELILPETIFIFPTVHGISPLKGRSIPEARAFRSYLLRHTCLATVAGLPQVSMPLLMHNNCPLGVSIVGGPNSDMTLLSAAIRLTEA